MALTLVGPFGFAHGFNQVAGSNTYGPVSPVEALGIWPASNYRLNAAGGAQLTGLAGAIAALARARRRRSGGCGGASCAVPVALGACAVLYLASLPFSGEYSQAKALMIAAPLAMLVAMRPLLAELGRRGARRRERNHRQSRGSRPVGGRWCELGWGVLAVVFVGGGRLLELPGACATRRSGRRGTGAELQRLPADPARQAGPLRGPGPLRRLRAARAPTPTCRWSSSPTPRSRRTRRSRSTPATPTARSTSTPSRAAPSTASPT